MFHWNAPSASKVCKEIFIRAKAGTHACNPAGDGFIASGNTLVSSTIIAGLLKQRRVADKAPRWYFKLDAA